MIILYLHSTMKSAAIFAFLIFLIKTEAQEWTRVYTFNSSTPFSEQKIDNFQFISPEVGYFSTYETTAGSSPGDADLYMTNNSGRNWEKIYTLEEFQMGSSAALYFDFLDERNFFLYKSQNGGLCNGRLFRDSASINIGFTPYPPPYIQNINLDSVILSNYTDENYIFLLTPGNGELNKIRITDDYLYMYPNWSGEYDLIHSVSFISGFGAAIGKRDGSNFFYSSDPNYEVWEKDTLEIRGNLKKVYFKNKNIGFIICNDSLLYRTQNAGLEWSEITLPTGLVLNDIQFGDTKGYIISADGRAVSSLDDGLSWQNESLEPAGSLVRLSVVNDLAYVVDASGQIFTNHPSVSVASVSVGQEYPKIYPNPVNDILNIASNQLIISYIIYNNLGQPVRCSDEINHHSFNLDLSDLKTGAYYIKISYDDDTSFSKIIKN